MGTNASYGMFQCKCGKRAYSSKSIAKSAKKYHHPHDNKVRVYHCDLNLERVWHLGHQTADRQFYRALREQH